ncbi:TIGR02391 family protein [Microbacterium sp. YY-03]|uniref:TIGR02391 family protein n=1 Tax=Microbacterium sp. YY-03 TaxID=3421636 RepID=UPI003D18145B
MTELKLTFDPLTIEHLGFRMYSHLPNAIAELIANSYDADANNVTVKIDDSGRKISVLDDGHGMSPEQLQENYLRIGRNRRASGDGEFSESGRRKVAGRKGLGKLAVFGIGNHITVDTKRSGEMHSTKVTMVWGEIKGSTAAEYFPQVQRIDADSEAQFTHIHIDELNRQTEINPETLAAQLSRLFNYSDDDFNLEVTRANIRFSVDRTLRYASIPVDAEWVVPTDFQSPSSVSTEATTTMPITGKVYAASSPLASHLRGITLYVRGRLANEPEFFGVSASSQAYAYLTGYIDVDELDSESDVISTDRRSVVWESASAAALRERMVTIVREAAQKHRALRAQANKDKLRNDAGVDIDAWTSTIQGKESEAVKRVLDTLTSADNDIGDTDRKTIVDSLREIAPEYADLHWRALHPSIQTASASEYKSGHYHHAVVEAIKQYVKDVRQLSQAAPEMLEVNVIGWAFGGADSPRIDVIAPYVDFDLAPDTQKNLRTAQLNLSLAAWSGFRDPIQHEPVRALLNSGVFTYQDCLDALSLISHLRRRINVGEHPTP